MTGLKRGWRRKIAAFLVLCLFAVSLQGTAVAAAKESGLPGDTVVLSFSMEQIREAASEAVTRGRHYDGSMEFLGGDSPGVAAQYQELFNHNDIFELDWISNADRASSSDLPGESGLRIFICADKNQLTAKEPESELFDSASASELKATASESDLKGVGSKRRASDSELEETASRLRASGSELAETSYCVTGDEQLMFLFTNQTDHDLTYRLMVDGILVQSLLVPSGESLIRGAASASEVKLGKEDTDEIEGPDAPQSPEEEFERMGLSEEDEYEESDEESESPAERSKLLAPVLVKEQPQRGLIGLLNRSENQDAEDTAVLYLTTINTLLSPFNSSQFQVTLYDYFGMDLHNRTDEEFLMEDLNIPDLFPDPQSSTAVDIINTIKVYDNVKLSDNFFSMDEDGYYSYQSTEKGARYQDGVLVVQPDEEQFLPFGERGLNQPFGMKLQFDFYLPEDGTVNGRDAVFHFGGNDDVWIYLHDKKDNRDYLILGRDGLQGSAEGVINFTTGEISYRSHEDMAFASLYSRDKTIENYMTEHEGVSPEQAQAEIDKKYFDFMDFDGSYGQDYQLRLYYLNRSGENADCNIKFNLPVIPRNGVSLLKQFSGTSEPITDGTAYHFKVSSSTNRSELRSAHKGEESDMVTVHNVRLKAGEIRSLDFLTPDTYYFVEEMETYNTTTNWNIAGGLSARGKGTKTNIFKLDKKHTGSLLIYNRVFNGLNPQTSKSAWKDETVVGQSEYDIVLQVTGDSIAAALDEQGNEAQAGQAEAAEMDDTASEAENQIITLPNVINPTVTVQLSDKVVPININHPGDPDEPISIWLYDGKIDETGVTQEIKNHLVKLTAVKNGDTITYSDNSREVASYSIPDSTLVWSVADQLAKNETGTLIYRVRVTEEYHEALFVEPDDNTGTHSLPNPKEKGYYASQSAVLTYNGSLSKTLPHPVVRPQEPDGSIIIEKKVTDTNDSYQELDKQEAFEFTVNLKQVKTSQIYVQEQGSSEKTVRPVTDGAVSLKFSLKDGESYRITGLNRDAEYIITESEYTDDRYLSKLNSITVRKNGQIDESGVDLTRREVSGTLIDSGGTRIMYSYEESTGVSADDRIQYDNSLIEDTEAGETGWYDEGVFIPEGDSRFYKQIGGTVIGQAIPGKEILTWRYDSEKSVIAERGNRDEIHTAQNTAEGWLRQDGYTIDVRSDTEPYSVIGSRRGTLAATERIEGSRPWFSSRITWNGRTPAQVENDYPTNVYFLEVRKDERIDVLHVDVTWTYSIYKRDIREVAAEVTNLPDQPYWEYQGASYTSAEALIEVLAHEGYKAWLDGSNITYEKTVKKTNQELFGEGFRHRKYSSKEVAVPPSDKPLHIEAIFNNFFDTRGSISVEKKTVVEAGMTVPENEVYTFEVHKLNTDTGHYELFTDYRIAAALDTTASKTEEGFTITGAGKAELLFEPDEKQAGFRIKETNNGSADTTEWDGQPIGSEVSGVVKVGDTVICTNRYSNRTLTISKTLSEDSVTAPETAKVFRYEVVLTAQNGTALSTVGYDALSNGITIERGIINGLKNEISLTDGTFVFTMKAGDSLTLNRIPAGTAYTVKELSMADETLARYYQYTITETKQNGRILPGNPFAAGGSFGTGSAGKQSVEYKNQLSAAAGQITVRKEIVDQKGSLVPDGGDGETFILRIENKDPQSIGYGSVFYAALTIQSGAAEKKLSVPYGEAYAVTEEAHLRYRVYGSGEKTVSTAAEQNKAVIQNCRINGGYLSDSRVRINTVNDKGFPKENEN